MWQVNKAVMFLKVTPKTNLHAEFVTFSTWILFGLGLTGALLFHSLQPFDGTCHQIFI